MRLTGISFFPLKTKEKTEMRTAHDKPANDNAVAIVYRIEPIALASDRWIFLIRKRDNGFEFTVVPAPLDPDAGARYLRRFAPDGWTPYFVDEERPDAPFAFEAPDVRDPVALRALLLDWSLQDDDGIDERRIARLRFVAQPA